MYAGKLVFAQVMEFAPWHTFRKYRGDFNVALQLHVLCMAFAQLTYRESARHRGVLGSRPDTAECRHAADARTSDVHGAYDTDELFRVADISDGRRMT